MFRVDADVGIYPRLGIIPSTHILHRCKLQGDEDVLTINDVNKKKMFGIKFKKPWNPVLLDDKRAGSALAMTACL